MGKQQILSVVPVLSYSTPSGSGANGQPDETVGITFLAQRVNRCMADHAELRARYLEIYGEEWAPLPYAPGLVDATPHRHTTSDAATSH